MDSVLNNVTDTNESNASADSGTDSRIQEKKTKVAAKAVAKNVDTNKVLEYFKESIDITNSYTLDEYKKLITAAFKEASKKTKRSGGCATGGDIVKREPTKYNIFVKEEILKLKAENPDKQYKDLMKMAADKWNENKLTA